MKFILSVQYLFTRVLAVERATPTNNNMTIHTNTTGTVYYSKTDEDGQTIYSFTEDFDDIWTQEVEDEYEIS